MSTPLPLKQADLSQVRAVFTDVDGTLTIDGRLESHVVAALELLDRSGVKVVLVSGRPAGWGECWARQLPVHGVIVENGALAFVRTRTGLERLYSQPEALRRRHRVQLQKVVAAAMKQVKGARLSSDSAYTEVDLAIDYAEEASLGVEAALALEAYLRKRGVNAVRSSVHVNCWYGEFDKASAVKLFVQHTWRESMQKHQNHYVYSGDSLNDAPMFAAFSLSVGVANVIDVLEHLDAPPKFVTRAREGAGFVELAKAIVKARQA